MAAYNAQAIAAGLSGGLAQICSVRIPKERALRARYS